MSELIVTSNASVNTVPPENVELHPNEHSFCWSSGFLQDKFFPDSYLFRRGNIIYIPYIKSLITKNGCFRRLVEEIFKMGYSVAVPCPEREMHQILFNWGAIPVSELNATKKLMVPVYHLYQIRGKLYRRARRFIQKRYGQSASRYQNTVPQAVHYERVGMMMGHVGYKDDDSQIAALLHEDIDRGQKHEIIARDFTPIAADIILGASSDAHVSGKAEKMNHNEILNHNLDYFSKQSAVSQTLVLADIHDTTAQVLQFDKPYGKRLVFNESAQFYKALTGANPMMREIFLNMLLQVETETGIKLGLS